MYAQIFPFSLFSMLIFSSRNTVILRLRSLCCISASDVYNLPRSALLFIVSPGKTTEVFGSCNIVKHKDNNALFIPPLDSTHFMFMGRFSSMDRGRVHEWINTGDSWRLQPWQSIFNRCINFYEFSAGAVVKPGTQRTRTTDTTPLAMV